jgi:hypothetical protein
MGLRLADFVALFRRTAANLIFDPIQCADPLQCFPCYRGSVRLFQIEPLLNKITCQSVEYTLLQVISSFPMRDARCDGSVFPLSSARKLKATMLSMRDLRLAIA